MMACFYTSHTAPAFELSQRDSKDDKADFANVDGKSKGGRLVSDGFLVAAIEISRPCVLRYLNGNTN